MVKRHAYTIHEHRALRWMMLFLGDRVEALENQVIDTVKNPWFILSVALSAGAAFYLSKPAPECPLLPQRA